MAKRRDTSIESVGAEHLVMGYLMREGIQTYMADQRQQGYDLICVNPNQKRQALIQVKSRWATNSDRGFLLKNSNSDFIAIVFLNCGYSGDRVGGKKDLEILIIPTKTCLKYRNPKNWNKILTRRMTQINSYYNNWSLIKKKLGMKIT